MSKTWAGGSTRAWRVMRSRILMRDGYQCQIKMRGVCVGRATHVHHLVGKGAGDDPKYLVAACAPCNLKTGDPTKGKDPAPAPVTRW